MSSRPVTQTVRATEPFAASAGRQPGGRHHRRGHRQHADGGEQWAVAADALQVLQNDEGEAEEGEELDEDRQAAG